MTVPVTSPVAAAILLGCWCRFAKVPGRAREEALRARRRGLKEDVVFALSCVFAEMQVWDWNAIAALADARAHKTNRDALAIILWCLRHLETKSDISWHL